MELVKSTRTLQVIGDTESTSFGIGDEGMIIKYLTENTYSNPLKAMVQEIMSNGRDAHIETGLGDRSIVVKLPNGFYPTWEVRDFGPGLTPQRMKKVFTQYGSSTKRSDNSQSGGFGIGAKTPWAYTDTFTVTTISDEYELVPREVIHGINPYNGEELIIDLEGPQEMIRVKRMKRSYACVKGEDYKNKLIESTDMACEIDLNDPSLSDDDKLTGTTISVEIAERDFDEVLNHTMSVSQWWNVRPIITGKNPTPEYTNYTILFQQDDWKMLAVKNDYYSNSNGGFICIDGIPYPLNINNMKNLSEEQQGILKNKLVLHFKVGELEVNLNREQLRYTDKTIDAIKIKIDKMVESLKTQVNEKLDTASNIYEAHMLYKNINTIFNYTTFVKQPIWKGINISQDYLYYAGCVAYMGYPRRNRKGRTVYTVHEASSIKFEHNMAFMLCDEPELSNLTVNTYLNNNPSIEKIIAIKITDPVKYDAWCNSCGFNTIPLTVTTSSIPKAQKYKPPSYYSGSRSRSQVVKAYVLKGDEFEACDVDITEGEGVYVEVDRKKAIGKYDGRTINNIRYYMKDPVKVYGIPSRFVKTLGDEWETFEDHINDYHTEHFKFYDDMKDDIIKYEEIGRNTISRRSADWLHNLLTDDSTLNTECPLWEWHKIEQWYKAFDSSHVNNFNKFNNFCSRADLKSIERSTFEFKKLDRIMEETNDCFKLVDSMFDHHFLTHKFKDYKDDIMYMVNKYVNAWIHEKNSVVDTIPSSV